MMKTHKELVIVLAFLYLTPCVYPANIDSTNAPLPQDSQQSMENVKSVLEARRQRVSTEQLVLPEDDTQRLTVSRLEITGNTLLSTETLLKNMPLVYNASEKPLSQADTDYLYDFSALYDVVIQTGQPHDVSARTMEGFNRYVLSAYQQRDYAGIRVYVPEEVIAAGRFKDDILNVRVLEAYVSDVNVSYYDPNRQRVEEGHLRSSLVREWSPVRPDQVINQKKLDDYVSLLNRNPDRYVSPVVSTGTEPNSLALSYDIYESNPWHYYIQVDNSGTEQREWAPRIGLVNTNLLGFDDRFTAMYQAPWDSGIDDNYLVFGSYGFPLLTPRLRLDLYGGYSEFDVTPEGGAFNFLGRGSFYGGILNYNLIQAGGWFFDLTGSLGHEESKVTPSLFPTAASEVDMDLLGVGFALYKSTDTWDTSFGFNRIESIDASDRDDFEAARTGASPDFRIYTAHAGHSRYLDPSKVHRLSGSLRYIDSSCRLAPAKMTTFGGLYSVRGYDEDEIVADGGILASVQYEFDLIKHWQADKQQEQAEPDEPQTNGPAIRKLAPLAFLDYGRAVVKDQQPGEEGVEELLSIGLGAIVEVGDNFSGALYYGWAIRSTTETDDGDGRLNISMILRW
jgi:hemolysin activation/secretion protein